MRTGDFDYHLPQELIAQSPIEPRDSSRLLVMHRNTGALDHNQFSDILGYLRPGDVMVFNQSRVIPARLYGRRVPTGSNVEFLLINRNADGTWHAMAKPGRRLRPGAVVEIEKVHANPPSFGGVETEDRLSVEITASHKDGLKTIRLSSEERIDAFGHTPLPPYIKEKLNNDSRYQTVYAHQPGSVAAPTAGLHFTNELLEDIRNSGVDTVFVTLHVGLDTFKPVDEEDPTDHKIHTERYRISPEAAESLNRARTAGRRIIAVGTTSVRVLEQAAQDLDRLNKSKFSGIESEASIFILPGHNFRIVDAMVTNFHLPRSSLLMLVSAFVENNTQVNSGCYSIKSAYQEAINNHYRFYSFGDAMLIL